jgi:outer membrane protein assembly factor BamB
MNPILFFAAAAAVSVPSFAPGSGDWAGWRGPGASGVGEGSPPVEWSEQKNVRWKAPLPGRGLASPIVWGERVFVVSAVPTGKKREGPPPGAPTRRNDPSVYQPIEEQDFVVLCFERPSGKELWRKVVHTAMPHQTTHPDGTYASPTPVTDGTHVFVSFGSFGLYALTFAGEVVWQIDLGDLLIDNEFGEGSSPLLVGDLLVLNWDHEGDSFLVGIDKATGKERWRTPRPQGTSWSTPIVVRAGETDEIVVAGVRTIAYDAKSGRELWSFGQAGLGGGGMMASPVAIDELVLCSVGGRRGGEIRALVALPEAESGEPTEPLWARRADVPGIPSLLHYQGKLYFLKGNSGMLSALDPTTGAVEYGPERLKGVADVYASPVAAAGRLYVAGRDGTVEVLSALPKVETLAVNVLEDAFDASPALAGDELFLRGRAHLYCIAAPR